MAEALIAGDSAATIRFPEIPDPNGTNSLTPQESVGLFKGGAEWRV
jgi:hypothetical protein